MTGHTLRGAGVRTAVLGVLVLLLQLVAVPPASAHSELERSDPTNGGMVAVGRSFLTFWFGEEVSLAASTFELRTQDGTKIDVTVSLDGGSGAIVRLDTAPLEVTTYELDWHVLSLADGHPSSGSVLFGVGIRPDVVPSQGTALPDGPLLVLRWLDLLALMLVIGAISVSGRVLGSLGELGRKPRRRVRRVAAAAAVAGVYAGVLTPFIRTMRPGNPYGPWLTETWATLTGSPWGHLWLLRELAVLVAAVAIWSWSRRPADATLRIRVAVVALGATAFLEAWSGHASVLPSASVTAAAVSAAHVLAAGVWGGGLMVLALCVVPVLRREPHRRRQVVGSVFRTFSPMAAVASVVLVATGLYEAGRHVPDLSALTTSVYGGTVAFKLVLVLGALLLAGVNTLVVNPRIAARVGLTRVRAARFGTTVTAEALVLLAAVAAGALLTSVPTAREVGSATALTAPHSENVDGLFITFEEVPGGPGVSRMLVGVRSTILPPRAPVSEIEVLLTAPDARVVRVPLDRVEEGRYEADTPQPIEGRWVAEVSVRRSGLPDAVSRATWVQPSLTPGRGPLEQVTTWLAVLLLAGLGGVVVWVRRRPGRRREPPPDPAETAPQLVSSSR